MGGKLKYGAPDVRHVSMHADCHTADVRIDAAAELCTVHVHKAVKGPNRLKPKWYDQDGFMYG